MEGNIMLMLSSLRCHRSLSSVGAIVGPLVAAAVALPGLSVQDPNPPATPVQAGVTEIVASKQSDGWGAERDGLRTRLVPAQEEYTIGQPARFRLEMKNFGKVERTYDSQQAASNGHVSILDPDGKRVPYVGGLLQTEGDSESIAPGETAVLFDKVDLADQYMFIKPGVYSLQFLGLDWRENPVPPSDRITVELRPGRLPAWMQITARLIPVMPERWTVSAWRLTEPKDGEIQPPGWASARGMHLTLERGAQYKDDVVRVGIWVAERPLKWSGKFPTGQATKTGDAAIYLGKGAEGHVYWKLPKKAEIEWPDIGAKVKEALKIETPR